MKKFAIGAFLLSIGIFTTSCSSTKTLSYDILPKSDTQTAGKVTFKQNGDKVTMQVDVTGLTPGAHAIHLHEIADCSAPDAMSTGGHWNPAGSDHGKWGDEHFHMGDIGNLMADENGHASMTFTTDHWCISCLDENKDIMNKSVIIHAEEDDFHTQPTGNAGGRVGCVEIK
ncbi:MAG TPA: superoxide dismutase family protein [Moheibacter sp.]|nr:superoxide dismutase family protein [Moheibacter sp.]